MAKKYIDADRLKAEIKKRRLHFNKEAEKYQALNNGYSQNCYGARDALRDLENFIDSLQQEQPSEDLEKYASRAGFDYVDNIEFENPDHRWNDHDVEFAYRDGIIAGAEWQKEQMIRDCSVQASYEAEIEKAEERGYNLCKEQMLEEVKDKGWVARDKDGTMTLFRDKPIRYGDYWTSKNRQPEDETFGPLSPNAFLGLKWEDEPVEVGLIVKILQHITMAEDKKTTLEKAKRKREQMMTDEEMKCALRMEYEKGVFDTRQQMLEDAVKGTVCKDKKSVWIELIPNALPDYEDIEPVKCVVIKED